VAENAGPYNEQFTIGNIESMIQLAKANKIKVILASVIPATKFYWRDSVTNAAEKIISLNKCLLALSKKHKISYLDYHSKLKNSENGLSSDMAEDGVHPTLKCFEIMAKMVLKSLGK
jgi:lysophospholipase L1-like esterase